ncbi:MAG: hypothetical protein ACYDIA_19150 [Candidatus Humimicrobiaceae bacterium]
MNIIIKNPHNLYIWGNSPLNQSTCNNLKFILKKYKDINILCFCSQKKSEEFKRSIKNITITTTIFNDKKINNIKNILDFRCFYFPGPNDYKKYKKFLENNSIEEPLHHDIGYRFYPPFYIILKYDNNYFNFLKINKGNEESEDQSLYIDFLGSYKYENKLFECPYITYHPGGGILDFKTKSNNKLLKDKIDSYKYNDIENNKIFNIFSIKIFPGILSKLEKNIIDFEKFLKRNWINFVEVGLNSTRIIKQGEAKVTYIIFNIESKKKSSNLYFYIHKKIGNKILDNYFNYNYLSIYFQKALLDFTISFKEENIITKNIVQDLKVIMKEKSFNLIKSPN